MRIADLAENRLQRLRLPWIYEPSIFLTDQIVDVVCRALFIAGCPFLHSRHDLYCTFQCPRRVESSVSLIAVPPIHGLLDVVIDILPHRIADDLPKWCLYLDLGELIVGNLDKAVVV